MRTIIIAGALAVGLSGCATISALTGASLTTTQVYVTANAFDAGEVTATNYLKLPVCVAGGPTVCRNPAATAGLVSAVRAGYQARQSLVASCEASTTAPACVSAYTTVSTAVNGLQSLFSQYSIAKGS